MKRGALSCMLVVAVFAGSAAGAFAQEESLSLDELMDSAQQWASENLDQDVLSAFQDVDEKKARKVLDDLQTRFHGEYVIDLASVRDSVKALLPLLEGYEETLPIALWLKTRLDYFDMAEQLRLVVPAPRNREPKFAMVPPPKVRELWIQKVRERPWPQHARPYVTQLKPVFIAQQVPAELVWLAEVESSFDPRARSPVGAAGLFQLMPETAKRFGLRTWPLDQRLKPEPSAQAAAQYLRYLYKRYGDWRLALAAYNAGEGTVDRLLKGQKVRSFDAIASRLPAETQLYVPKFEATLLRREGMKLSQLSTTSSTN